ncbi:MAG TPA: VOC family protein [Bryobacteraceae bacterium]|nr:VOC family protein [Bryobacteraceae bacterium]HUO32288.1 VOC family protein [Bryobacteraceae bacterium]
MKITAVLIVESIEKSLPFWIDRMGFTKTVEVPEEGRLGFAILVCGGAELMLQTIESVRKDAPQFVPKAPSNNVGLFIEVDDFAGTLKRLEGYPIALPERTTFYGMREIGVFEPSGHTVVFAAPAAMPAGGSV